MLKDNYLGVFSLSNQVKSVVTHGNDGERVEGWTVLTIVAIVALIVVTTLVSLVTLVVLETFVALVKE